MSGADTLDDRNLTIPANSSVSLNVTGTTIANLQSDADIYLSIDDDAPMWFPQGITLTLPSDRFYSKLTLENRTASPNGVHLYTGFGDVKDNRLSVTAALNINGISSDVYIANSSTDDELQIKTKSGTALKVDDDATQTALATVNSNLEDIEADIESNNQQLVYLNNKASYIEDDIEATNTLLTATNSALTGIEADIEATNTLLSTIDGVIDNIKGDTGDLTALLSDDNDLAAPIRKLGDNVAGAINTASVSTLISPTANVNGVIIRTLAIVANSNNIGSIMAKTSAPSSFTDTTAFHLAVAQQNTSVNMSQPIKIPAGVGVYIDFANSNNSAFGSITYDLL